MTAPAPEVATEPTRPGGRLAELPRQYVSVA